MPAHDSLIPGESKSRGVRVDGTGISMSWKSWKVLVAFFAALLFGGTGFAGIRFVTSDDLLQEISKSEQRQEAKHVPIRKNISEINDRIEIVNQKIDDVQLFQYRQDARQEARRITENIAIRDKRESEYDRLRELNERRLRQGKDPCSTLECLN